MKKFFSEAKGHLMTGIGYMLPLIIGSSLVVAIPTLVGLAMGVTSLTEDMTGSLGFLYQVQQVGWTGIGLVNTVLAAFIAYSIADKPAIGAGFVGGAIATSTKAGFLGAVLYAFIAGYIVRWAVEHIKLKGAFQQVMPLVILPFLATGAIAIIGVLLATPLAAVNTAIVDWLRDMCTNGTSRVVMAVVLGAMIAFDMGGPVNKAAWMAGNVLLLEGIYTPAVFVNCAICIPPLGYAIASVVRKARFSQTMRDSAVGNWVMGFIGITEGAIPFTLVKPTRLIPVNIIGGALGAAICALLGTDAIIPPLGGMYGFVTMTNPWGYLIGMAVGALFIGFVAPLVADFNVDPDAEDETMTEDEVQISFE
jgi:PTS system fructose-specific IIC component